MAALTAISGSDGDDRTGDDTTDSASNPATRPETLAAAVIVLLTDGENTAPPDPLEAAQAAIEQGVRVHTIGFGSRAGTTLEIDGFTVHTQLSEPMLQDIALLTEGEYLTVENSDEVDAILKDVGSQFVVDKQEVEITSVLGGISMVVLLIGGGLSLIWFGRMP
jgi:Ca-activated chloride channel family protein